MASAVPPLPAEDHVCLPCGTAYADVTVADAVAALEHLPAEVLAVVQAVPTRLRGQRPAPDTWSVAEYSCHLRDVFVTSTIRLHRARTENRPMLEPMLNDLRARRFHYAEADVDAVLGELGRVVAGFRAEARRLGPDDEHRTVTRLPGEERTARWLVRHALHEGRHHLGDIRAVAALVAADESWSY